MLVSPAERDPRILALGTVSSLPERVGADILFFAHGRKVAIQRKDVRDLRASAVDGRLAKEIGQMSAAGCSPCLLVVEGKTTFDTSGVLQDRWGQQWTYAQWVAVQWSIQHAGCWVQATRDAGETAEVCRLFEKWVKKKTHHSLASRPAAGSIWGSRPDQREFAVHFLQGLEGVGPELAGRIYDAYGGLPVQWRKEVDEKWLTGLEGVGRVKAKKILGGLNGSGHG